MDTTSAPSAQEQVAAEVRAELARRRISGREIARRLGWTNNYAHRRFSGETPLDVNDLVALADLLDVPVTTFFAAVSSGTTSELSIRAAENPLLSCDVLTLAVAETVPVVRRAA